MNGDIFMRERMRTRRAQGGGGICTVEPRGPIVFEATSPWFCFDWGECAMGGERAPALSSRNEGGDMGSVLDEGPNRSDFNVIFSYQCDLIQINLCGLEPR